MKTARKEVAIDLEVKNLRNKKKPLLIKASSKDTLFDLHGKILVANNWYPEHAFSFFMSTKFWDTENEYCGNNFESCNSKIALEELNLKKGATFLYLYDYGEEHRFEISVLSEI